MRQLPSSPHGPGAVFARAGCRESPRWLWSGREPLMPCNKEVHVRMPRSNLPCSFLIDLQLQKPHSAGWRNSCYGAEHAFFDNSALHSQRRWRVKLRDLGHSEFHPPAQDPDYRPQTLKGEGCQSFAPTRLALEHPKCINFSVSMSFKLGRSCQGRDCVENP